MAQQWTCNDCGSDTTKNKVDATGLTDPVKQYVTVPGVCSNSQCPNRDKRNHSLEWCTEV